MLLVVAGLIHMESFRSSLTGVHPMLPLNQVKDCCKLCQELHSMSSTFDNLALLAQGALLFLLKVDADVIGCVL